MISHLKATSAAAGHIGTWSYIVGEDRCFVDGKLPDYFGAADEAARAGLPLQAYLSGVDTLDRSFVGSEIERGIETGLGIDICYRLRSPRHGLRVLRVVGRCYYDLDQKPLIFSGSAFDITPRSGEQNAAAIQHHFEAAMRLATADRRKMLTYFIALAQREAEQPES